MDEPYSPATPRPISSTSPSTMKMLIGFLAAFILAQTIGTVLFCLYLHMKMDKMEEVLSLNEDYIFLRKIQKCQTAEGQKSTLLDCEKILKGFQDIQCKDEGARKGQPKFEMQRGHEHLHLTHKNETSVEAEKRQPIAAHLAGLDPNKTVSVLEWKTTMYGPMNNGWISYQEGKLKVKEAGLYYIYSQVSFCTKAANSAPFTLYIYLYLPMEKDRLLLKGLDTHSTSMSHCDLQSIREGGVFKLREGDMVFVNVTDSRRVNYNPGSTYFGIFKL
ncbi:CD40 ligand isoform X1 [Cuculus canorus]|uniref:CD40 ligand isoform X1 n=1 Tax=Cuculus canorus TaxID=55661 RepID=UPI0023AAC087|nr:CD40 ligand isoform X1 [Cuculus canorus]XP_053931725.1 CD40 ligand isoform X1 [Cuculus canorus]XP_053931727.1 CD40 ligand isoform X1 [Cuculus canorus]XP_053931728.1 CD40 ligand isoform X1 [Cuculus canorus]